MGSFCFLKTEEGESHPYITECRQVEATLVLWAGVGEGSRSIRLEAVRLVRGGGSSMDVFAYVRNDDGCWVLWGDFPPTHGQDGEDANAVLRMACGWLEDHGPGFDLTLGMRGRLSKAISGAFQAYRNSTTGPRKGRNPLDAVATAVRRALA